MTPPLVDNGMTLQPPEVSASKRKEASRDGDTLSRDRRVVEAVLDGDREAFRELVDAYGGELFGYLYKLTRSQEEAEEIVQEAIARAYEKLGRFNTRMPFRPWLYRLATNLAISGKRRKRFAYSLDDMEGVDEWLEDEKGRSPADEAIAAERRRRLRAVVDDLPAETRAMVIMFYDKEMSLAEIAIAVRKTPNAVKVALHRARERIKATLETEEGERK